MSVETQGAPPVVDRRPIPRGVLPKGIQTWLMVALSVGMVLIIFLTGQPQAPQRAAAAPLPQAVSPDRVRDYQQRLQLLNEQLLPQARPAPLEPPSMPPAFQNDAAAAPARVDAIDTERRRRDYESLFASNVVVSKRAPLQKSDRVNTSPSERVDLARRDPAEPSLDEIADAVVRATSRTNQPPAAAASPQRTLPLESMRKEQPPLFPGRRTYRVTEGTVIDTVLTNRLDGGAASPVNCLVTNAVYSTESRRILIPAGSRILGSTRQAEGWGETRLAVGFHRLVLPDGTAVPLDQFRGLNQFGDSGLKDQANQHYWSTFGSAAAVGLVGGLSQLLGSAALGSGDGDRTVIIAGGAADGTSQAASQSLSKFLNRMPTITIREGHRVKVYVTSDFELPEWNPITSDFDR